LNVRRERGRTGGADREEAPTDELVPFTAGDGRELNLIHVRGQREPEGWDVRLDNSRASAWGR
jgi:hypothetical protein